MRCSSTRNVAMFFIIASIFSSCLPGPKDVATTSDDPTSTTTEAIRKFRADYYCDDVYHGGTKTFFLYSSLETSQSCEGQLVEAKCFKGTFYYGDNYATYKHQSCTEKQLRYLQAEVPYGSECVGADAIRICTNNICGDWSPNYTFTSCKVADAPVIKEPAPAVVEEPVQAPEGAIFFDSFSDNNKQWLGLSSNISISNGTLNFATDTNTTSPGKNEVAYLKLSLTPGQQYQISYDISNYFAGELLVRFSQQVEDYKNYYKSQNGNVSYTLTPSASEVNLLVQGSYSFGARLSIDNLSIVPVADTSTPVLAEPVPAPIDTTVITDNSKLLFKSSFDGVQLIRGRYGEHKLVGKDTKTGFNWPDDLPGITDYNIDQHYFNYVIASNKYTSGEDIVLGDGTPGKDGIGDDYLKFVETRIDQLGVPGVPSVPNGSSAEKALYIEYKGDDPDHSSMTRNQYVVRANKTGDPVQRLDQGYVKTTIFLHINPAAQNKWLLPYEWKQEGEYGRIGIYIYKTTTTDAYWYVQMQDGTLGSSSPTIWSQSNQNVPVPKDQWFTLEAFWVGSPDPAKGRLKVAVNGVVVFDIRNRTKRVEFDTPYYFSPFKHYGSIGHQWITDFEYRDIPPKESVLSE